MSGPSGAIPKSQQQGSQQKHQKLKKKYAILLQTHKRMLDDYQVALETITKLTNQKAYLKTKMHQVLNKAGFQVEDIEGLEQLNE